MNERQNKFENVGNGMPDKMNSSRSGADPPKNVSGSTVLRLKYLIIGSGSCITATNLSNAEPCIPSMKIWHIRSRRLSAALRFSTPFPSTLRHLPARQVTLIGKGGQRSSDVLAGVTSVQTICSPRRRGDSKIIDNMSPPSTYLCQSFPPPRVSSSEAIVNIRCRIPSVEIKYF
jgi:hypothetical protein